MPLQCVVWWNECFYVNINTAKENIRVYFSVIKQVFYELAEVYICIFVRRKIDNKNYKH